MTTGRVEFINPDGLMRSPAFTHVVVVSGPVRTIYVGGQDSMTAAGEVVGKGDIVAQTEQVLANLLTALAAAGAGPEHVIKWNLLLVDGQSIEQGYAAFQRVWGNRPNPPVITAAFVSGLANPDLLVEMDAIAVVPLERTGLGCQSKHVVVFEIDGPERVERDRQRALDRLIRRDRLDDFVRRGVDTDHPWRRATHVDGLIAGPRLDAGQRRAADLELGDDVTACRVDPYQLRFAGRGRIVVGTVE